MPDMDTSELKEFVRRLADTPQSWRHLVEHDRAARTYSELLRDDDVAAWLICWMDEQDTGFHDHDVSAGAVAVVSGSVREDRLVIGAPPTTRVLGPGDAFSFEASDIHRVRHAGDRHRDVAGVGVDCVARREADAARPPARRRRRRGRGSPCRGRPSTRSPRP